VAGVAAGLIASVPQVFVTQFVARRLDMPPGHADIGPRFVERFAERLAKPAPPAVHWLVAGFFHFGYAAAWGALYGAVQRQRRLPPQVAGPSLASLIYTLAFSRVGAATQTGSEPHPDTRSPRRHVLHWTPAITFSLLTAYCFEWLRPRATTL
jgi:hypothetical protein